MNIFVFTFYDGVVESLFYKTIEYKEFQNLETSGDRNIVLNFSWFFITVRRPEDIAAQNHRHSQNGQYTNNIVDAIHTHIYMCACMCVCVCV